ncbi:hypothetical protein BRAO375_1530021 [Bradyrhizobium sp. ORS 375]|nr:hypothetical protein BRAO375_1530021 [Bradyrhizobium sp. ORS 375]
MNGRVYDPLLARFTSADPVTESPFSTQGWNRYSYVGNDPLTFTDPSGHCFLGCFWNAIGNFLQKNPIARSILQIGATVLLNVVLPGIGLGLTAGSFGLAVASAAGGAMIATGLSGGNLGEVLKAGLIAGVTAAALYGVGNLTGHQPDFGTDRYFANVAGHALVGCGSSVASGGDCKSGALSAAVGSALSPLTRSVFQHPQENIGDRIGGAIVSAVAGGVASVAGGGKFANGAITGAFGYLFNEAAQVAQGRLAESMWKQSVLNSGGQVVGQNLLYEAIDSAGERVIINGKILRGEMDGLSIARDGLVDAAEVKNGNFAKYERTQLQRSDYIREGQIRFYGESARQAGIEGMTLKEVAGGRPIWYRLYVGPMGAQRAMRQYLRYQFRFRGGGDQ